MNSQVMRIAIRPDLGEHDPDAGEIPDEAEVVSMLGFPFACAMDQDDGSYTNSLKPYLLRYTLP